MGEQSGMGQNFADVPLERLYFTELNRWFSEKAYTVIPDSTHHMAREKATAAPDTGADTADGETEDASPFSTESTATATIAATRAGAAGGGVAALPNTLTIIGQGVPSSVELTVDGEIEPVGEDGTADVTLLSGTTVEGTVENGTVTVRFSGDLTDVTFVDRGITGRTPATTPNVHVDYGTPDRSRS